MFGMTTVISHKLYSIIRIDMIMLWLVISHAVTGFVPRVKADPARGPVSGDSLNTAAEMDDLEATEKEVILRMNRVRHDPAGYADQYLVPALQMYRGKLLERPGQIAIETREGRKALKECIAVLQKTQAMPILRPVVGLCRAARDHALDIGTRGIISHTGSDGSSPFDRMERYGVWKKTAAENIDYGSRNAEEIIYSLLVDDGVPSRAHRQTLLNPDFLMTGVSIKPHKKYRQCCIITYAAQYGGLAPKRKLRRNL